MVCRDSCLHQFHFSVGEFDNLATFGTNKVIVVSAQMSMLITYGLILELFFLRKPQIRHPVHTFSDKFTLVFISFF